MGLTSGGSKVPESRVCYGFYAWQVVCAFYSIDNFGRGCWECEKKKILNRNDWIFNLFEMNGKFWTLQHVPNS